MAPCHSVTVLHHYYRLIVFIGSLWCNLYSLLAGIFHQQAQTLSQGEGKNGQARALPPQ